MNERKYYNKIWQEFDSQKHLILISGPRQTGKTTFAKQIASKEPSQLYFNYDIPENRATLISNPAFFEKTDQLTSRLPLIILDEIHKYKDWKNYLKGIYDGYADSFRFLVTGSGRLDLFRHKGDSLAGRFLQFHIFPFTIGELYAKSPKEEGIVPRITELCETFDPSAQNSLEILLNCGGFPEPFCSGRAISYRRWAKSYHSQIIKEDIRSVIAVKNIDAVETLYSLLIDRVGSPLSAANLASTLKVSHNTVSAWLDIFEKLFLVFRIRPYSNNINRSLLREPKLYFYDCARAKNQGEIFENLVAVELLRAVTLWTDYGLGDYKLYFLRNKEKEEVDFLVTEDGAPIFMVEAKLSDTTISSQLQKFQNMLNIPAIQLVVKKNVCRKMKNGSNSIMIVSAARWLTNLC